MKKNRSPDTAAVDLWRRRRRSTPDAAESERFSLFIRGRPQEIRESADINKALSDLQAKGMIAELAAAAGITYLPPREPIILRDTLPQILQK